MEDAVNISYKQMVKKFGVPVSEIKKAYNNLIKNGYIKELEQNGSFQLTVPDTELAATIPNPIRFKS